MITCPCCQQHIESNEIQCKYCGTMLVSLYCSRCGNPLDLHFDHCRACRQPYSLPYPAKSIPMQTVAQPVQTGNRWSQSQAKMILPMPAEKPPKGKFKKFLYDNKHYAELSAKEKRHVLLQCVVGFLCVAFVMFLALFLFVNIPRWTACSHNYVKKTCTESVCTKCGKTQYAMNHKGTFVQSVEPTCVNRGYSEYLCSICGETYQTNYVNATGHSTRDGICDFCGTEISILDECELKCYALHNTYAYKPYGTLSTKAKITKIEHFFLNESIDDTVSLTVLITFQKTYDYRGENSNSDFGFVWRVLGENRKIVAQDVFWNPATGVLNGSSFSCAIHANGIPAGTYTLEISEYQ